MSSRDRQGSPRAAARRLPRAARRSQLLAAAQEVFVAAGYHAALMDDIAERAGVTKPVLYRHFPGKLDLYLALLDRHVDDLVSAVRAALASAGDGRERVHASIAAYFDFVDDPGGASRLVFESDLRHEPAVRQRVERALHECAAAIGATIAAETGLGTADARLLAVGVAGMAEVAARWWLASGAGPTRDRAVALLETLAWRGLAGSPPPA